jgi:hypothetical protein
MTLVEYVKTRSEEVGDCWEWQGALQACGTTPMMRHQSKTISVRRLIMQDQGLEVEGKVATCTCGNHLCVNPEHLELITRKKLTKRVAPMLRRSVSMLRKSKISIMARHRAKLTVEMAEEIRQAEGKQRDIAKRFGVSQATVSVIKRGLAWRDYNNPFALLIK